MKGAVLMLLYNSLSRQKDVFTTVEPGKVKMYTCGPTVYHFAHIGNLRTYIMEDVLDKYLRFIGNDVLRIMNITDVGHLTSDGDTGDDKMLKGAKREHKTVMEIAAFYTDAFFSLCLLITSNRIVIVCNGTPIKKMVHRLYLRNCCACFSFSSFRIEHVE